MDLGVEQTLPIILDKFKNTQQTVFAYYIVKFLYESKTGQLKAAMDCILKAGELGIEVDKITQNLRNKFDIDLEIPVNLDQAVEKKYKK